MELIIELSSRSGHVLERHILKGERISIGRAYNNDLILSDETVDPRHVDIHEDENGQIIITDLESVNGIRNKKHKKLGQEIILNSGDEYLLGKARLRIFTSDHPVSDTISLNNVDSVIGVFSGNWVSLIEQNM